MPTTVQRVRGRGLTCKEYKTVQAKLLLQVNYYQAQTILISQLRYIVFLLLTAEMCICVQKVTKNLELVQQCYSQ